MNLKRVISGLILAVVLLAITIGLSWATMGKRTVTQVNGHSAIEQPARPRIPKVVSD